MTSPRRRILVLADSPTVPTGFAQVTRNVLKELYDTGKYEFDVVGINFNGVYDREKFEKEYYYINHIIPARYGNNADMYGRGLVMSIFAGEIPDINPPYDLLFTIQDHFIIGEKASGTTTSFADAILKMQKNTLVSAHRNAHFLWVGYYPVDGMLKQEWVDEAIAKTSFPVAYCEFGENEINRFANEKNKVAERLSVIRHGVNTSDFHPLSEEKKKEARAKYFPMVDDDTFLIVNVNRNQMRKDLLRTFLVYKEFKKKHPKSFLYFHCNAHDLGGNLFDLAHFVGMEDKDFGVPKYFDESVGYPISVVNEIYNAADCILTTTLGEGWGFSITEALATKTPIVAPNITSIPDILDTHNGFNPEIARGIVFDAGRSLSEVVCYGAMDNEVIRPISNVEDAVSKLKWVVDNPTKVKEIVERGYKFATELTWKSECKKWEALFDEACAVNDQLRIGGLQTLPGQEVKEAKLSRNDLCPLCQNLGKKIKIKKCVEHRAAFLVD